MSDAPASRSGADYVEVGGRLLAAAAAGAPGLEATIVAPAALVLGSAQPLDDADTELAVVKRGTGGGAVLCDPGVLLVDLAVPAGHALAPADVTEAYRPLGACVAAVLAGLGVATRTVGVAEARAMDEARKAAARRACWAGLSPYEVLLVDGRKLAGLAQRRRGGAVLHQLAIPVTTPPARVADHLVGGDALRHHLVATACLADAGWSGDAVGLWAALGGPLRALVSS